MQPIGRPVGGRGYRYDSMNLITPISPRISAQSLASTPTFLAGFAFLILSTRPAYSSPPGNRPILSLQTNCPAAPYHPVRVHLANPLLWPSTT